MPKFTDLSKFDNKFILKNYGDLEMLSDLQHKVSFKYPLCLYHSDLSAGIFVNSGTKISCLLIISEKKMW